MIFIAVAALNLVLPYLNRVLVDDYIKADQLPEAGQYVLAVLMILLVTFAVRLLGIARSFVQVRAGTELIVVLRQTLFQKIEALSYAGFESASGLFYQRRRRADRTDAYFV